MSNLPPTLAEMEYLNRAESIVHFLSSYAAARRTHTQHMRDPALLLGQYVNKPNVRRNNAPVILGGILQLADIIHTDYTLPAIVPEPRDEIYNPAAERIFSLLEPYRQGPEGLIVVETYREIAEQYGKARDRRVEIGSLALAGFQIQYPAVVQTAHEAQLALQLDTIQAGHAFQTPAAMPTETMNTRRHVS
jgi:hypothetical protein